MQKQYHETNKRNLPIYGVSTKSLKDFVTSARDQLRNITNMPSSEFRLWEVDIVKEDRNITEGEDFEVESDDAYESFVIV